MNRQSLSAGLGNFRNALLPVPEEVASQIDPRTLELLRKQAVLQMGLGMMGAAERGAGLGTGALFGLQQGQQSLGTGLGQAWSANRASREDKRLAIADERTALADQRTATAIERQFERDKVSDERWQAEKDRQAERDRISDERWDKEFSLSRAASARAAESAARAETNLERSLALAEQSKIDNASRVEAGKRIAELRRKGTPDTDPKLQELYAYYETLSGANTLRRPPSTDPLDALIQGAMPGAPGAAPAAAGPKRITSDAEYDALPSGTTFVGPDGIPRRKP
jgi:hypothetical protein